MWNLYEVLIMQPELYVYTPYSILYAAIALVSLQLGIGAATRRNLPHANYLALMEFSFALWAAAIAVESAAATLELKLFWSKAAYLGTTTAPVLYLVFSIYFCGCERWLSRPLQTLLVGLPLVSMLVAVTNELHSWLWTSLTIDPRTNLGIYGHGPYFWVLVAYSYASVVVGGFLIFRRIAAMKSRFIAEPVLLFTASVLPIGGNLIYVLGVNPVPGLDWTLVGAALGSFSLAQAIFTFNRLHFTPIAQLMLLEHMQDGVLVLDHNDRLVDINPAAQRYLGITRPQKGIKLETIGSGLPAFLFQAAVDNEDVAEFRLTSQPANTYKMRSTPILNGLHKKIGTLVVLSDISNQKNLEANLQSANARLEQTVQERTEQLNDLVEDLMAEVRGRQQAEANLQAAQQSLANRVTEQSRQLTALYEIIMLSGGRLDAKEVISQNLGNIIQGLTGNAAMVFEVDLASETAHLIASLNVPHEQASHRQTLLQGCLPDGEFMLITDHLDTDQRIPDCVRLEGFQSAAVAPIQWSHQTTGYLSIYWRESIHLPVEDVALFLAIADQLGMVMENSRLRMKIEETAVNKERRRLARELHDSVTQSIHSLVISTDTALNRLRNQKYERLENSLINMETSARQALKDMRLLLYELRLVKLEEVKLKEALQARIESVEQRAGIQATLAIDEGIPWPPEWQGEVYATIMEAMNNSLRYAQASKILVSVCEANGGIHVLIEDDGVGFDLNTVGRGGHGLDTMSERAEKLGGRLEIITKPGEGTKLQIEAKYPIAQERVLP